MENNEFLPIQNDEELAELNRTVRDGLAVKRMVTSDGWKDVLKPKLDARIGQLLNTFRNAKTYEDFIIVQQAINAIESVMSFCSLSIILGEQASKRIELQNEKDINK